MSTRKSTRTGSTGPKKAEPTKAQPKQAGPKKAAPTRNPPKTARSAPEPEPEQKEQKPYCPTCGTRLAPEEGDPHLGSVLLYDDPDYANLAGALFLSGWQSQILQKVIDGSPAVIVIGTPVDETGQVLRNRKIVTATWVHRTDTGWVQMAELCGYSRFDGTGFQNRTAEQLIAYIGRNTAEWVKAPIDDEAETASKGKQRTSTKAEAQDQPAPEPTVDPESKGLPAGSTPAPQDEPDPATNPEAKPAVENPDPAEEIGDDQDAPGTGEELEVAEEEVLAEPTSGERVSV
ncbi:hypothetical protein AB0M45_09345 [Nocardia sp. NPDC051787]|uniref:hypothetical protein n=1 Tax=Nocardia sp. NPDC051787 TaxID=3155415 RepID=UPI0034453A7E